MCHTRPRGGAHTGAVVFATPCVAVAEAMVSVEEVEAPPPPSMDDMMKTRKTVAAGKKKKALKKVQLTPEVVPSNLDVLLGKSVELDRKIEKIQQEIKEIEAKVREHQATRKKPGKKQAPPGLKKFYSMRSKMALDDLNHVRNGLETLSQAASEVLAEVEAAAKEGRSVDAAVRDVLAQLHGDCMRLVSTGGALLSTGAEATTPLDAIHTGELESGKDDARAERKVLVNRAEALASKVEALIGKIDAQKK